MTHRRIRRPPTAHALVLAAAVLVAGAALPATASPAEASALAWPVPTTKPTVLTNSIWFRGRGWGHGVGLSQYGARGRALAGQTHAQILAFYYKGTSLGTVDPKTQVRVRVLAGFSPTSTNPFTVVGRGDAFSIDGLAGAFPRDASARLDKVSSGWRLTVKSSAGAELASKDGVTMVVVRPAASASLLQLPPRTSSYDTYRGLLRVRAGTTISVVNELPLDTYLRGVVPAEMPSSWPVEALKAQAYAARSYAYRHLHPDTGTYDVKDDTSSQVYLGQEGEKASTDAVITATSGGVVKSGSSVANTVFHSTAGASTENNEYGFVSSSGGIVASPVSYLRGRADLRPDGTSYDDSSSYAYWKTDVFDVAALSKIFAKDSRTDVGTLLTLDLTNRGVSGRLYKIVLRGTTGIKTVSGDVFRSVFNANNGSSRDLKSNIIDMVQAPVNGRVGTLAIPLGGADPFSTSP
jgi:SpoIID/LytB domain protein